jgi:hypothetical protein
LETSSIELIEKLVARRYPDLSQIDAHTIAVFSDGNPLLYLPVRHTCSHRNASDGGGSVTRL